tara:strand:- start:146 stop:427 length:282 start_codon:yes stop_codon:yes gene_type:complete
LFGDSVSRTGREDGLSSGQVVAEILYLQGAFARYGLRRLPASRLHERPIRAPHEREQYEEAASQPGRKKGHSSLTPAGEEGCEGVLFSASTTL